MNRTAARTIAAIGRRFAGREDAIDRAYRGSESFRILCRDYLACVSVLERWQRSSSEDAGARVAEYSELLSELTKELEAHLGKPVRKETERP